MSFKQQPEAKVTPIYDGPNLMEYRVEGKLDLRFPLEARESMLDGFRLPPTPQTKDCVLRYLAIHLSDDRRTVEYAARFVPEQYPADDASDTGEVPQGCEPTADTGLKQGAVVQLRSGGPIMTFDRMSDRGSEAVACCTWFNDQGERRYESFPEALLTTTICTPS